MGLQVIISIVTLVITLVAKSHDPLSMQNDGIHWGPPLLSGAARGFWGLGMGTLGFRA